MSETVAQVIVLGLIGLFMWLGRRFDRPPMNWTSTTDDVARHATQYNRATESHLRIVKDGAA